MPEGPKKLSDDQKKIIREWIESGSPTLRDEPEDVEAAKYTPEELDFWSFQPVSKVQPPSIPAQAAVSIVNTPIDAFIASRLVDKGLPQSPEASKEVLLRRVTFDLTGLPPSPQELDDFLADDSPDAYERVVDRLLNSIQFGVRWGRHWLDIAGYSETEGHLANDVHRPHAWRYRDYVIESINADMPYDQFLREQIAGDEILGELTAGMGPNADVDEHVRLLTATGFLQMAPDLTSRNKSLNDRNQVVAETMKVVSSAVLGLTVGCAQCHDHRYDPISAEDYYRFRAVFDPAFPIHSWQEPTQRVLDLTPSQTLQEIAAIEVIAQEEEKVLNEKRHKLAQEIYDRLVSELPDDQRELVIAAANKGSAERSEDEVALLKRFPNFNTVESIVGRIVVYDAAKHNEFFQEEKRIAEIRASGPARRIVMCVRESDSVLPESAVFARGDPMSPKGSVAPGEIFVLARHREAIEIPENCESLSTTGRRLAYARQLTDGTHPTVARVAVNRVWAHHFGQGIVPTTGDLGLFGERPSHPELLDFLAADLVDNGRQMKRLHKMIVMSHTFRQQSSRTAAADQIDPSNQFLSRMQIRRLEAEEIRDAILMVTGCLTLELGGVSVPVATQLDGRTVIGRAILNNGGLFERIEDVGDAQFRRSLFLSNERVSPLTMLSTFDAPTMSPNCEQRGSSTVAPQSLWFLNDNLMVELTDRFASRVFEQVDTSPEARVRDAFRRFFGREATPEELNECIGYLRLQTDQLRLYDDPAWQEKIKQDSHIADEAAFASLCQSLLSTNPFLYIE
ncbi:MAG: DUF1549 domain-containing protein, partial [Planctomycetaceae bacterium]|nr:DUF1549 domain-containing protein [Planctomycetaceae bacterium]